MLCYPYRTYAPLRTGHGAAMAAASSARATGRRVTRLGTAIRTRVASNSVATQESAARDPLIRMPLLQLI